jgi:hypothetical protein
MKRTILTCMFSLMAIAGMAAAANAQFPIVRGVARNAVRVATPNVDVNVGGAAVAPAAQVAVDNQAGVAVVTRRVWVARPRIIANAAINAAATNVAQTTVSAATNVQATAAVAAPVYAPPAPPAVDCCGNVIHSSSSYSGGATYASSRTATTSVVAQATPVATAAATVTRSVIARPIVGAGVNVVTPRVGVQVGR